MYCRKYNREVDDSCRGCANCSEKPSKNGSGTLSGALSSKAITENLYFARLFEMRLYELGAIIDGLDMQILMLRKNKSLFTPESHSLGVFFWMFPFAWIVTMLVYAFAGEKVETVSSGGVAAYIRIGSIAAATIFMIFALVGFIISMCAHIKNKMKNNSSPSDLERADTLDTAEALENIRSTFSDMREDAKNQLKRVYDMDVIMNKYKNILSVLVLYDYFSLSRCKTLTGADGAYDLYESEVKNGTIPDNFSDIREVEESLHKNKPNVYYTLSDTEREAEKLVYACARASSEGTSITDTYEVSEYLKRADSNSKRAEKYFSANRVEKSGGVFGAAKKKRSR